MEPPPIKRIRVGIPTGPTPYCALDQQWEFRFAVDLDRGAPRKLEQLEVWVRFGELDLGSLVGGRPDSLPFLTRAASLARHVVLERLPSILAVRSDSKGELFNVTSAQADGLALIDPDRVEPRPDEWADITQVRGEADHGEIFICHAESDKNVANVLRDYLRKADKKVDVFVASHSESLSGGQQWWDSIRDNLQRASVVLTLVSPRSKDRPWLHFESGGGLFKGATVIPLAIPPEPKSFALPLGVLQGYDLGALEDIRSLVTQVGIHFGLQFENSPATLSRSLNAAFASLPTSGPTDDALLGSRTLVLDSAWHKLQDAVVAAETVYASYRQFPDLDRLPANALEEFLEQSTMTQYHKNQIRDASGKTDCYVELARAQEFRTAWQKISDLREFLQYSRIYIERTLADDILACAHGLSVAMIDYESWLQAKEPQLRKEGRDEIQKVRDKARDIEERLRGTLGPTLSS